MKSKNEDRQHWGVSARWNVNSINVDDAAVDRNKTAYILQKRKPALLDSSRSLWIHWFNILFWGWVNPILEVGNKRNITFEDLAELPQHDKSSFLRKKIATFHWNYSPTWLILINSFKKDIITTGLIAIIYIGVRVAQPLLIYIFLLGFNEENSGSNDVKKGLALCVALLVCTIGQAMSFQLLLFRTTRLGIRIRNVLSLNIYQHLLSTNIASIHHLTTAHTVNLIANDVHKFEDFSAWGHFLWAAPLEGIFSLLLMIRVTGLLPTSIAFTFLLSHTLVQMKCGKLSSSSQQTTMECTDRRIKALKEILIRLQIIKMYNWEKPMEQLIEKMRRSERSSIRRTTHLRAIMMGLYFVSPVLAGFAIFGNTWLLGYELKATEIFTTLIIFNQLRLTLGKFLPLSFEKLYVMFLASKRIDEFMSLPKIQHFRRPLEYPIGMVDEKQTRLDIIYMRNASFAWGEKERPILSSLNINIKPGKLIGIIGSVGSGKSSFFAAILGEMNKVTGTLNVGGSIAYVAQTPWIFPDTIRANILLGKQYDEDRYRRVLHACCLDKDLKAFEPTVDSTVIGEMGISLSGGQRARVSLARALYHDANIYLLDDPFSAIDQIIAKQIFNALMDPEGLLKGKTCLMATHQTNYLTSFDEIILLINGGAKIVHLSDHTMVKNEYSTKAADEDKPHYYRMNAPKATEEELNSKSMNTNTKSTPCEKTITDESSTNMYYKLFSRSPLGCFGVVLLIFLLVLNEILYDGGNYWLATWSCQSFDAQQRSTSTLYVFSALTLGALFVTLIRADYWFYLMLLGSTHLHNSMIVSILHAPIHLFGSSSIGSILNRATRDQYLIDEVLPTILLEAIQTLMVVLGSIVVISFINRLILFLIIPVALICHYLLRYFLKSSRQLKQLENTMRSPVYSLLSSSLNGLTTIRTFEVRNVFFKMFLNRLDANTRASLHMLGSIHWFALRIDIITTSFAIFTAIVASVMNVKTDLSYLGLCFMYSLNVTSRLQWSLRQFSEAEHLIGSARRINEYAQLPAEEISAQNESLMQALLNWPTHGSVEFRNYTMSYRNELKPVLKNINMRIESGEKIGIIGHTGAGKSSLFQAILRLIEPSTTKGTILIDGIDINSITLNQLRNHIVIVPQEPSLFTGTIRYNLDPFNDHTEYECYAALEAVQMKDRICNYSDGLSLIVNESGINFSAGESQLICLARAILKKTKILLIDEGTSNINQELDSIIQEVIFNRFRDSTVLTIAHRLNTIEKYDRIIVMEQGEVVNFDVPKRILKKS